MGDVYIIMVLTFLDMCVVGFLFPYLINGKKHHEDALPKNYKKSW